MHDIYVSFFCIVFSMDPLRSEIKLYYITIIIRCLHVIAKIFQYYADLRFASNYFHRCNKCNMFPLETILQSLPHEASAYRTSFSQLRRTLALT